MGQVLHGSAKTTHAIRAALQRSQASIKELSERYDLNPKTVAKWKKRDFVDDAPMGAHSDGSRPLFPIDCDHLYRRIATGVRRV